MVHAKRLRDARADPPLRVERRCRILEDHLELGSPRVPPGGTLRAKWQPAKENRPGRRWKEAHDGASQRGLAAAGLADQAHGLGRNPGRRGLPPSTSSAATGL